MSITGDDLKEFAAKNNLLIHPSKDPEEWAKIINSNNGTCHCDPNRTCPCDKSIEEVHGESVEPKFQKCCCTFFVSPGYLDEYGYNKKQKKAKGSKPAAAPNVATNNETSEKIGSIIARIKDAKSQIANEAYDDSIETLATAVEESGCEICEKILVPEMVHIEYVRGLCGVDTDACVSESKALKDRLDKIVAFYNKALETPALPSGDKPMLPAPVEKEAKQPSEYHQCLKTMLTSGELAQYEKPMKFYIASKVCSGKAASVEDAIVLATTEHPEWF